MKIMSTMALSLFFSSFLNGHALADEKVITKEAKVAPARVRPKLNRQSELDLIDCAVEKAIHTVGKAALKEKNTKLGRGLKRHDVTVKSRSHRQKVLSIQNTGGQVVEGMRSMTNWLKENFTGRRHSGGQFGSYIYFPEHMDYDISDIVINSKIQEKAVSKSSVGGVTTSEQFLTINARLVKFRDYENEVIGTVVVFNKFDKFLLPPVQLRPTDITKSATETFSFQYNGDNSIFGAMFADSSQAVYCDYTRELLITGEADLEPDAVNKVREETKQLRGKSSGAVAK